MNKVIKSALAEQRAASTPFVLRPGDALSGIGGPEAEAQDILTRTKQHAEVILRTAKADAKAIVDQAYSDGYEAGAQKGAQSATELIARLEKDIDDLHDERAALHRATEEQMLMLTLDLAEKVIRHEIRTDKSVVARTMRLCLRRLRDRDEVTVRVNPSEVAAVRTLRDEILSSAEGVHELGVIDDRRVSPGGCVVETASGDFDARIETQISELRKKVMEMFENDAGKLSGAS